ncbi:malate dehydrogenase [Methylacidiphilum caldifontis]|uniref:Malate dehydrogenase n=1 Tax=Methylacidiphilum caldifontis TaxID=2795386 RepID=A0A4Y8PH41_9BACT|nr:malate dehydrogenase [Methylacidiphilum caldifontis]QSR88761.1 malate dehydrogenase [Methylacidiphilum caldifontis]TFE71529.1 malate dehydrogenase [Methylacidiphilum caldifontis]
MKISIIGAGFVGATTAQRIWEKNLGDVFLYDIIEDMPQGKALDMMESAPILGIESKIVGTNRFEDCKDSDIFIITSGLARQPGMSRDDLLNRNAEIASNVAENIQRFSQNALVIVVSNPVDVLTYLIAHKTKLPKHRVMGMAGVLDSARFRYFIASELDIAPQAVQAMVLGGHGDEMVPLSRFATVSGVGIEHFLSKEKIEQLIKRTREGGAEIVKLLKKGSAYYAPSASILEMVESIVKDQKRILPCSAWCEGHYGVNGQYIGVPVILGRNGVEKIIELPLTEDELEALQESARHVAANVAKLNLF